MRQEKENEKVANLIENLTERRKELNCIYQLNDILRDYTTPLETIFRQVIAIIPSAWRYSDICNACIIYGHDIFEPVAFKRSKLKQSSNITIEDQIVGEVHVYYTRPITNDKGIFLPDEQKLLNTIADKLSSFILLKRLKEAILQQQSNNSPEEDKGSASLNVTDWLRGHGLTEDNIQRLMRVKIEFRKGETICKQGALNSYIMLITQGYAKAYLEGYQEKGLNFKILQPYDFIGLTSIKEADYYRFSVSAITPCTLYLIDKDEFIGLMQQNLRLNDFAITWYCHFTGHLFTRLHCVANKQAPGRIADVLLYLSGNVFNDAIIPPIISRRDIAELAGMSTESAVRILSELKNDQIIKSTKEGITLLKPDLIKTISLAG